MNKATIKKYASRITHTETSGKSTLFYIGDNFIIEASQCFCDLKNKKDLMNIWKKHGYISKVLPSYISICTYYYNEKGCRGLYNIIEKLSADGKRREINFNYLKEATPENMLELVAECIRLAVKAKAI